MPRGTMGPKLGVRRSHPPSLACPASPPSHWPVPPPTASVLHPCLSLLTHSQPPFLGPCPTPSPPSTPRLTCLV